MVRFFQIVIPILSTFPTAAMGLNGYEVAAVAITLYFFIDLLENFSRSIWTIIDLIIVLALFTWTVMPIFAYHHFNEYNRLAILWDKVMKVPSIDYYSFVLPGTLAMVLGLKWPSIKKIEIPSIAEFKDRNLLQRPKKIGYQLIFVSLLFSFIDTYLPSSINFVTYLFSKLFFTGVFYLYFSDKKPNVYLLFLMVVVLLLISIRKVMFGEMIYMIAISGIIITLGWRLNFFSKLALFSTVVFFFLLIQSVKKEYRQVAWNSGEADYGYFTQLIGERIQNTSLIFSEDGLFGATVRFNQGWLISKVMERVPSIEPYANGETIYLSLLASIVPRFLWPDKPKTGGEANMVRFLGLEITGTSMNISALGEAWANFGQEIGIIFMFFYGLTLRFFFSQMIKVVQHYPTFLLWFPLILFYVVVTETDVLSVFNHLFKTSFFVFLLFWFNRVVLKQDL